MKAIILIVTLTLCGAVCADQTVYDSDGRRVTTKTRDGADRQYFDRDGRRYESSRDYGDSRRYYGRDSRYDYDESED